MRLAKDREELLGLIEKMVAYVEEHEPLSTFLLTKGFSELYKIPRSKAKAIFWYAMDSGKLDATVNWKPFIPKASS